MPNPHCEAIVPARNYRGVHLCSKWANLRRRKVRGRMMMLCPHHRAMVEAGNRLEEVK